MFHRLVLCCRSKYPWTSGSRVVTPFSLLLLVLLGSGCGGPCGLPALQENEAAVAAGGHVSDLSGRSFFIYSTTVQCARSSSYHDGSPLPPDALLCELHSRDDEGVGVDFALTIVPQFLDGHDYTLHSGDDFTIGGIHYLRQQASADGHGGTQVTQWMSDQSADMLTSDLSLIIDHAAARASNEPAAKLTGHICASPDERRLALGFQTAWLSLP